MCRDRMVDSAERWVGLSEPSMRVLLREGQRSRRQGSRRPSAMRLPIIVGHGRVIEPSICPNLAGPIPGT